MFILSILSGEGASNWKICEWRQSRSDRRACGGGIFVDRLEYVTSLSMTATVTGFPFFLLALLGQ